MARRQAGPFTLAAQDVGDVGDLRIELGAENVNRVVKQLIAYWLGIALPHPLMNRIWIPC